MAYYFGGFSLLEQFFQINNNPKAFKTAIFFFLHNCCISYFKIAFGCKKYLNEYKTSHLLTITFFQWTVTLTLRDVASFKNLVIPLTLRNINNSYLFQSFCFKW